MRRKQLTLLLAGAILASNIGVTSTTANAIQQPNSAIREDESINPNSPTVAIKNYTFDRANPKDIVITGINFKNTKLTSFFVGTKKCDDKYITCSDDSITISKDFLSTLTEFSDNSLEATSFTFTNPNDPSDTTYLLGYVSFNFVNTAPVNPPSGDDKDEESKDNSPTVAVNNYTFDRANPEDIVITGVDFKNTKLTSFFVGNEKCDDKYITCSDDSITISKDFLLTLTDFSDDSLEATSFTFTNPNDPKDTTYLLGYVSFKFVNTSAPVNPPAGDDNKDNNNRDDDNKKDDVVIKHNPSIGANQDLNYDLNEPKNVVINNVDFDETDLSYVIINGTTIKEGLIADKDNNTITILASAIEKIKLVNGNYDISFKFTNSDILHNKAELKVTNSAPEVIPPVVDGSENKPGSSENGDNKDKEITPSAPIVIDKNNLTEVKIPNFIPADSKVESIVINNKVLTVKYKNARILTHDLDTEHVVYIDGDNNLIIPVETLKYIGLDEPNFNITANLADGSKLNKTVNLNVTNSPNTDSSTPDTDNTTDNIIKPGNTSNFGNVSNSGTTNSEATNKAENNNIADNNNVVISDAAKSTSVKTGDVAAAGLLSLALSSIAGMTFFRKKK